MLSRPPLALAKLAKKPKPSQKRDRNGGHAAADALTWGPGRADRETRWGNLSPGFPKPLGKYSTQLCVGKETY